MGKGKSRKAQRRQQQKPKSLLRSPGFQASRPISWPADLPEIPAEIREYGEEERASLSRSERRARINRHLEAGKRYFDRHEYQQALDEYLRGLVLMTEDLFIADPIFNLAQCYGNLGKRKAYMATMRYYMELEPRESDPYFSLAYAALMAEEYEEVIRLVKEGGKRIKGRDPKGFVNMARAYAHLGRYQESLSTLEEAIRIAPNWADAYSSLGACHEDMGNIEQAKVAYRWAAELDPTQRHNLDRLEQGIVILGGPPPPWTDDEAGMIWEEE